MNCDRSERLFAKQVMEYCKNDSGARCDKGLFLVYNIYFILKYLKIRIDIVQAIMRCMSDSKDVRNR